MPPRSSLPLVLIASLLLPACVARQLPPPAPPAPSMPSVAVPPATAGAGMARVVLSTDVPARAVRVLALSATSGLRTAHGTVEELLCESTPCAVTLPYGDHEVRLTPTKDAERMAETVVVHVADDTVVVDHTLGRRHDSVGHALGSLLVALGVVTTGAALVAAAKAQPDLNGPLTAAGVGFGTIALGGVIMDPSPNTEQPGATTQWTPPPSGAAAGLSLGAKF